MTPSRTAEERREYVQAREKDLADMLKNAVRSIHSSDRWRAYLETMSHFWDYSFRNQLLLACQMPDATAVAGFAKWRDLGRTVKKGERALWILAPSLKTVGKDELTGEAIRGITGFRGVGVFDVAQTEGADLDLNSFGIVPRAPGHDFVPALTQLASKLGYMVSMAETGSKNGFLAAGWSIVIKVSNPTTAQAKTIVHELAHGLLGHLDHPDMSRELKELQAETTAYVVSKALGLELDDASFNYLAHWTKFDPEYESKLENSAAVALTTAKIILREFEKLEAAADAEEEAHGQH